MTIDDRGDEYAINPVTVEEWRELEQHAFSAVFPAISGAQFDVLRKSLLESGLHHPIMLFEGKVLDGWQRYRVCCEAGIKPHFEAFAGNDRAALMYVVAVNQHRVAPEQWDAIRAALQEVEVHRSGRVPAKVAARR